MILQYTPLIADYETFVESSSAGKVISIRESDEEIPIQINEIIG